MASEVKVWRPFLLEERLLIVPGMHKHTGSDALHMNHDPCRKDCYFVPSTHHQLHITRSITGRRRKHALSMCLYKGTLGRPFATYWPRDLL